MPKQKKEKVEIICASCGKKIKRLFSDIEYKKKKGTSKFYCDKVCVGKSQSYRLDKYRGKYGFTKENNPSQHDEYSHFRYHLKGANKRSRLKHRRKKDVDITLEQLKDLWNKQNGVCAITGIKLIPRLINDEKTKHPYQASLDRIDNSKDYTLSNIRFVCLIFNYARNNFSDDQVIDFCSEATKNKWNQTVIDKSFGT
jgi:hypothetical protein